MITILLFVLLYIYLYLYIQQQTRYGAGSPSLQTSSGGYSDPYGGAGAGSSDGK